MNEDAICREYLLLLDKSHQVFEGLRELPSFGSSWRAYFQKTFEVFTKLWKYQQNYRGVLEALVGLKRYEIGDIASKIGQLYYHFYLRTAEKSYLEESFVFYDAISTRRYFADLPSLNSASEMLRMLRYCARFIVVCLLLGRTSRVEQVRKSLDRHVQNYITRFNPLDAQEWRFVLWEISDLLSAIQPIYCTPQFQYSQTVKGRIRLEHCLIVGAERSQVKFSELTLDMLRMNSVLERVIPRINPKAATRAEITESKTKAAVKNPRKHLFYRPSLKNFSVTLHQCQRDLSANGAMIVVVSGDATEPPGGAKLGTGELFDLDLMSQCRSPFVLILHGSCAPSFIWRDEFDAPRLVLRDGCPHKKLGSTSVYSSFLTTACWAVSSVCKTAPSTLQSLVETAFAEALAVLDRETDCKWTPFLRDDFLRLLLVKHLLACALLSRLPGWGSTCIPQAKPDLDANIAHQLDEQIFSPLVEKLISPLK